MRTVTTRVRSDGEPWPVGVPPLFRTTLFEKSLLLGVGVAGIPRPNARLFQERVDSIVRDAPKYFSGDKLLIYTDKNKVCVEGLALVTIE